jgi:hypothetical protein
VTRFLDLKGKRIFGKNHVAKRNTEMFPLVLGLESVERYQQVSSLIENHMEELQNKTEQYFPSLQHKCTTGGGTLSLSLLLSLRT